MLPRHLRRRYDRLCRFPAGLLVAGDAICSFNPTYGQGMTVAATQAVTLRACLEHGGHDLARRFFNAAGVPIVPRLGPVRGADLALPETGGRRSARVGIINAYSAPGCATGEHDVDVAGAFSAVVGQCSNLPATLRPAIAAVSRAAPPRRRLQWGLNESEAPAGTPSAKGRLGWRSFAVFGTLAGAALASASALRDHRVGGTAARRWGAAARGAPRRGSSAGPALRQRRLVGNSFVLLRSERLRYHGATTEAGSDYTAVRSASRTATARVVVIPILEGCPDAGFGRVAVELRRVR